MTSSRDSEEQARVAAELRSVRDAARDSAAAPRSASDVLPPPRDTATAAPPAREPDPPAPPPLRRPDATGVNSLWPVARQRATGPLGGILTRALRALVAAQEAFNSKQVQFDNDVLDYIDARIDETHRHYDAVLGVHGRHMEEIDERHQILQEDLVAHVHDLVQRIDIVFSEVERGRLSLEFAAKDLRERVQRLEERLQRG